MRMTMTMIMIWSQEHNQYIRDEYWLAYGDVYEENDYHNDYCDEASLLPIKGLYLKDTSDVKRSPGFRQVESPIEVEVPQVPDSAPRGRAQHVHHRLGEDKVQEQQTKVLWTAAPSFAFDSIIFCHSLPPLLLFGSNPILFARDPPLPHVTNSSIVDPPLHLLIWVFCGWFWHRRGTLISLVPAGGERLWWCWKMEEKNVDIRCYYEVGFIPTGERWWCWQVLKQRLVEGGSNVDIRWHFEMGFCNIPAG